MGSRYGRRAKEQRLRVISPVDAGINCVLFAQRVFSPFKLNKPFGNLSPCSTGTLLKQDSNLRNGRWLCCLTIDKGLKKADIPARGTVFVPS
jgi:hypothetical protein